MNILRWMPKKKEEKQREIDRAEENERVRTEQIREWQSYWQQVLDTQTNRVASVEELKSKDLIIEIIKGKWFKKLPRDLMGQRDSYILHIWASKSTENPTFFVSIGGWPKPHSHHCLIIGDYSDGVEVLKSRYDLIDSLIQRGYERVVEFEINQKIQRDQMLEEIQNMVTNDTP